MISAIGDQAASHARPSAADAGRRGDAVGQQAKAAVTAAREGGAELPKNAQGIAASGIARGADPASIFAALVTSVAPSDDGGDVGGVPTTPVDDGVDVGSVPVGTDPAGTGDVPVEATPSAPIAPPPPPVEDDAGTAPVDEASEVVQVAVSDSAFSVDDGEVALELLTAAQSG